MDHTIVRFANGIGDGWAEFRCGCCSEEIDLFDFDLVDVLEASEDDVEYQCPECGVSMKVDDLTPEDPTP